MSSYTKITRHPQTGAWEKAFWIDDYFGSHVYGVRFKSDNKVYSTDIVNKKNIQHFWAEDVKDAFAIYLESPIIQTPDIEGDMLLFLNLIEEAYKARWERDPLEGEGATLPA